VVLSDSISRLKTYYERKGLKATLDRALLFVHRSFSANRMIVFYRDMAQPNNSPSTAVLPAHLTVERKDHLEQIDPHDWHTMVNFWNRRVSSRLFAERLQGGASIWMVRSQGRLAGYGWSMTGRTISAHYCPFGANDVHFFDFLVFPEFRGRQINPSLVNYMLGQFAAEGRTRAYIEVAEWNQPQLMSLRRTHFHPFGVARKASLFGRTFVEWTDVRKAVNASVTVKGTGAANSGVVSHS